MEGIVQKILSGELNDQAKEAIVKGMFPLDPSELVTALYFLCRENETLLTHAQTTLAEVSEDVLENYFEDKNLKSEVLNYYLLNFQIPEKAKGAALLNKHLKARTLLKIAPKLEPALLDLAVNNQVKILEEPDIIEALLENAGTTINQRQKLEEYRRILLKDIISPEEDLEGIPLEQVQREAIAEAKEFVETFGKEAVRQVQQKQLEEESPEEDTRKKSVLQVVQNMSVPQKVQGAVKGDRELRNILVRDANKLVSSAVIRSPKITEAEVEFYANLRNVHTEVLRLIATNREWLKNYKVVLNLVKNPRTPLTYTMRLLNRINKKDMRLLVRDRNVPEALRTMARKITAEQNRKRN